MAEEKKQLTVGQLIELLLGVTDHSLPVWVEGCDCYQPAVCIELQPDKEKPSVLIRNHLRV